MSEMSGEVLDEQADILIDVPKRRNPLRRLGCGILLILWFALLLSPCLLFTLARQGEIMLAHADVPEPELHPLLNIGLISEIDFRGLRIVTSSTQNDTQDNTLVHVQTNVTFILWEGQADPSTYCDTYSKLPTESVWTFIIQTPGSCPS